MDIIDQNRQVICTNSNSIQNEFNTLVSSSETKLPIRGEAESESSSAVKLAEVQEDISTSLHSSDGNQPVEIFNNETNYIYRKATNIERISSPRRLSFIEWNFDPNETDIGAIDLAFPENHEVDYLPISYYTLSAKERLIFLFVENFRRQFVANSEYSKRRPLVLVVPNECNVQKFVCTTIRPTALIFHEMIGNWQECASFVSDFIVYEHLAHPLCLPSRLVSPDTLLRRRYGNSYEMATLLCSMLIGAGFAALVVSGTATFETTLNDQRHAPCPYVPDDRIDKDTEGKPKTKNKYELKRPPYLKSKFLTEMEEKALRKEQKEAQRKLLEELEREEDALRRPPDQYIGQRMHAWIVVIENAPWCYRPQEKLSSDEGDEIKSEPKTFFIEPTTGLRNEISSKNYLRIDSVWNNYNYYINRQEANENGLADMKWDLSDSDHWEHLLPYEPYELRQNPALANDENTDKILIEKHLDFTPSWVQRLHISLRDFEERFPECEKTVHYKKAIHQQYSPYFKNDGLIKKLTLFEDFNYKQPIIQWSWYENRQDNLWMIKVDFRTKQVKESFRKGRPDCLKYFIHNERPGRSKIFHYYHYTRVDRLKTMEISKDKFIYNFESRTDLVYSQEFQIKSKQCSDEFRAKMLLGIIEKCHRNETLPVGKDVAFREFRLDRNTIFLKFQYNTDAITRSTKEFVKPSKPDYGKEVIFDSLQISGYHANPLEKLPTRLELYDLFLKELRREEELKQLFEKRYQELDQLLARRKHEMLKPRLHFSIFDKRRNEGARQMRIERYEEECRRRELIFLQEPDFLAPYLVTYVDRKPSYEESWALYNICLSDLKSGYMNILNDLQRRYQELATEAKALKKFLVQFQDQFENEQYDHLLQQVNEVELNKSVAQQRLILTHEESQRKYEKVKASLLKDERLNLKK